MPSKVIFYTFMGRALQFYGDIFCDQALMQESHHRMMMANFFWKIGVWFYRRADKVAWSQILDPEDYPKKKYIYD